MNKAQLKKLTLVFLFAVTFGLLEAIVVIYLRHVLALPSGLMPKITPAQFALNLGVVTFAKPEVFSLIGPLNTLWLEVLREVSTIVILGAVAFLAGKTIKERLAYFLISFAVWDIFYYVFLNILSGWPTSLGDIDILFLIPVPWIAPVIVPVVLSVFMILAGLLLLKRK